MIEELKPKPMNMYKDIPNKEDCVEIKRQGLAPKGKYYDKCTYLCIDLEARINPWNEQVERAVNVAKCKFFGDLLISEKEKTPCGETFDRYKKCMDCRLQTDEELIKQAKELGVSTEELVSKMREFFLVSLMEKLKENK